MRLFLVPLLLLGTLPCGHAQEPIPPKGASILALDAEDPEYPDGKAHAGLLVREIVRQSILMAGRDGLGLSTRDRTLGEPFPDGATTLTVRTLAVPGKSVRVRIGRKAAPDAPLLWDQEIPLPPGGLDYAALVKACEALSRGAFIDVLKAAGLKGTPNAKAERGKVSDAIETALMTLTFTEQFRALRELHADARAGGDAPLRTLAIVRGYAHLGKMGEYLLYATHKAFKARSLLYAERASVLWPGTRLSLWTRAYARGLTGLHGAALEDIAAAAKIAGDGNVPVWVGWIEAFCRYDATALAALEAPYNKGLLRLLGFMLFEECRNDVLEVRKLREAIQANPECYYLYEAMCEMGGIRLESEGSMTSRTVMAERLYDRLGALADLPAPVRKVLDEHEDGLPDVKARPRIWKALLESPAGGEPSWPALGRFLQHQTFGQVWRKALVDERRNADPSKSIAESQPLWEDHPYKALIEGYLLDRRRQQRERKDLFSKVKLVDPELSMNPIFEMTDGHRQDVAWRHQDDIARDLETKVLYLKDDEKAQHTQRGRALLAVSPYNPMAVRALIPFDWEKVKDKADEWERHFDAHPQVLFDLGRKYRELKRLDDAERCLKKAADRGPSKDVSAELADLYKKRGDLERWQSTLDRFLEQEDFVGLLQARVRTDMAKEFMARKEWRKARTYAETAAQESNAAWALDAARDACEGTGDLAKAHEWQKRVSQWYSNEAQNWYFFVKRTGFGDEEEAEALALKMLAERPGVPSEIELNALGILHELAGRPKEALIAYEKALARKAHPYNALHAALKALELNDVDARDRAFKAGQAYNPKDEVPRERELLRSIAGGGEVDIKAWQTMVDSQDAIGKANLPYFMGRWLELNNRPEDAMLFYKKAVEAGPPHRRNGVLAAVRLRALQ